METPLLAAALIVKNEERFLPDCLASLNALRPLLSEICIYDTGSSDRTIEIAEAAGARVEHGYWDDDFSRARNASIAMCNAKWVMIVDADERVTADQQALGMTLRSALTARMTGMDVVRAEVRNVDVHDNVVSRVPSNRLLRPGRARYVGSVHERMVSSRDGLEVAILKVPATMLAWRHIGYALAEIGTKGARNLALADAALDAATEVEDVSGLATRLLNRARSLFESGRVEDALHDYVACWNLDTPAGARLWAGQDLGDILVLLGAHADAAAIARELQRDVRCRDFADWLMARARLGQGRWAEALELLRRIDNPTNAAGFTLGTADVIEARMIAEAEAGDRDQATACAIRLIAGHGRLAGRLGVLLALWGDRPVDVLAQLLAETGPDRLESIRAAAVDQGDVGQRLAEALSLIARPH